jgi:hypothetical protein
MAVMQPGFDREMDLDLFRSRFLANDEKYSILV